MVGHSYVEYEQRWQVTGAELEALVASAGVEIKAIDYDACAAAIVGELNKAEPISGVSVSVEQMATTIIASVPDGIALDDYVSALPEELSLVAACAAGNSPAIQEFERRFFRAVRPALRQMKLGNDMIDEVTQRVRQKLFVAKDAAPAPVVGYVGKGDLTNFVRVVAIRVALSMLRKPRPVSPDDSDPLLEASEPSDTPQMRLLKARHAKEFKSAFEQAMSALDAQERNLLRMSFVEKLNVDEIGRFYKIHRATAARRLARARARLAELTREILRTELTLDEGEFTSIVRLVHSKLDLSITRVLGD